MEEAKLQTPPTKEQALPALPPGLALTTREIPGWWNKRFLVKNQGSHGPSSTYPNYTDEEAEALSIKTPGLLKAFTFLPHLTVVSQTGTSSRATPKQN